ncbi:hypothetical protein J1N35_034200 [Gossypium stocksii]|uniref:Uncharacterized protein n=1 Tax=Gossypium stocksii TaxID=47602 RepID=A0A9D3US44_9ROSI|nr:hypothetical protein J1N35_034200 [Gossypium stocksii]
MNILLLTQHKLTPPITITDHRQDFLLICKKKKWPVQGEKVSTAAAFHREPPGVRSRGGDALVSKWSTNGELTVKAAYTFLFRDSWDISDHKWELDPQCVRP